MKAYPKDPSGQFMDLRDYFAAHAPPVPDLFMKRRDHNREINESDLDHMIRWRYAYADAMMKGRGNVVS